MSIKQNLNPVRGTKLYGPAESSSRQWLFSKLATVFKSYGYENLETPTLCPKDIILGSYGEEGDKLTYSFEDLGGRQIALPYDQTVPFAWYVASKAGSLTLPFKRYQMQRVWRAERPQRGRLREFYQCDIDIVGSKSLLCEAELCKIMLDVFGALKLDEVKVMFNSRKLLNSILDGYGVSQQSQDQAVRLIDKLDKIGQESVAQELQKVGVEQADLLMSLLAPESSLDATLEKLSAYDTQEIKEFLQTCELLGVDSSSLQLNPTLARGLDYYTGLVFEAVYPGSDLGTICAGGRYDNLLERFGKSELSGVGVAFGFERMMLLLDQLSLLPAPKSSTEVLVTVFDDNLRQASLAAYAMLQNQDVAAELYMDFAKMAKQLKYANAKRIPIVAIIGPDEQASCTVTIRRMSDGEQRSCKLDDLGAAIVNLGAQ